VADYCNCSRGLAFALFVFLAACAPKGEALYVRAQTSLDKGETRAAIIDLKSLVQSEPQNARARALLGDALVRSGQISSGEIELQRARELGAPQEMLLVPSCRVMLAKGEFDNLLGKCRPDTGRAGSKVELQILNGDALLSLNRAVEAKPLFDSALAAEPNNVGALLGLASASSMLDGAPAAKSVLDKAPPGVRKQAKYWLAVASINMNLGDFDAAAEAFQSAMDASGKDPESVDRLMALGGLAEAQMRKGDIDEADETTSKLIEAAPDNLLVKQLRGQVAAAGGKYGEARSLLEDVVGAQPENYQARTLLGIVNLQQGNLDQAEMHFAGVVANQPNDVRAQRLLAEVRAKRGSPEAMAGVRTALEQTGNDPTMLAMAGRLSLASGNREQALTYLAQAAEKTTSSTGPQTQLEIANGYLAAGELDRAIEILQAMPEGGVTDYQREYMLLLSLLKKGETETALAQAKALAARSGDQPAVRNLVASVYMAAGKPELAREQLLAAQKLAPDNVEVLANLARLELAQGKPAAAEPSFKRILEKDPTNLFATLGMSVTAGARKDPAAAEKWLIKAATEHPGSAEAQLALAQFYLAASEPAKAKAVVDAAAKAQPRNAGLANARGLVLFAMRELRPAVESFAEAVRLEPIATGYKLNLARAQLAAGDSKGAIDSVNDVLKSDPQLVPALALGATASLVAKDLDKATGYVERLRQAAPDSTVSNQIEGDLAMAQKRYADALAFYAKADPAAQNRNIVIARYVAAQRSGVPEPLKVLVDWVARNPQDSQAVAMLAEGKIRQGDRAGAIRLYEQALAISPQNGMLLNNLAMLYIDNADVRALATAEKAYSALPKVPGVQDTYGWALVRAGKSAEAVDILRVALQGMPDNAEVQYHLAAALAEAGNTSEALSLTRKALSGTLPPAARTDAKNLLTKLSK
jgi:putative PEP-CTERM system TPR-repeat lipoprotein